MVTVKVVEASLPALSFAVQVTVVTPCGKVEPEAGWQWTVTGPSTRSVAAGGMKVTAAPPGPVASATKSVAWLMLGAVVSTTVVVKLFVALLPWASVAVQVTVVVPSGKVEPEVG